ncbi:MAG: hypothetical protein JNK82_29810 [Myxococcaceae bacterium]|nr:hypothetical protein [Myxococcaceae bacterium]
MTIQRSVFEAFRVASTELGMCSAAWLFTREVAAAGGDALVRELQETLGLEYAALHAVTERWLGGTTKPAISTGEVVRACAGAANVAVVGVEADWLDALVPLLGDAKVTLLTSPLVPVDWERLAANFGGRVATLDMSAVQQLAGARSVLLTFCYGTRGDQTWVDPLWMRVSGGDVRTQFRSIVGWEVLGTAMQVYPRWLTETSADDFAELVS